MTKAHPITKPIMRYHGAKFRLAPWIIGHFPPHRVYVEPFGGAAGVLLQKPPSYSEVYNDLDSHIVNVFRVLQHPEQSKRLQKLLQVTPYAREEFQLAYDETPADPVEAARRVIIRAYMGFGSAGATKHQTGFRIDSKREYGTGAHLWADVPPMITSFCQRLAGVIIENRPALQVIDNHDGGDTLFFVDPPYVHSTRQMGKHRHYYRHEMSDHEHEELLTQAQNVQGMVAISGYPSELYNDHLQGWQQHQCTARISAGRGGSTRTECLWLNPACADRQPKLNFGF